MAGRGTARRHLQQQHRAFRLWRRARQRLDGCRGGAEPAQLRVARLRQPGRPLVLFRPARRVRSARSAQRQFSRARTLPRHRRAPQRARRRVCRPWQDKFRAPGCVVGGGRGAADRRMHRGL